MKTTMRTLILLLCASLAAPLMAERPVWNVQVDGPRDRELRQSFVTPAGATWLLSTVKAEGELLRETGVELVGVDAAGRRLARHELPAEIAGKKITRYADVAMLKSGALVVFASTAKSELLAVAVDPQSGTATSAMVIGAQRYDHYVSAVVPAEDGRLLIIGRANGRAWLAKVDGGMALRWERTYEDEPVTVLHDAVVNDDGSIVAVGAQLLPTGATNLWLASLTTEGQVIADRSFPGREAKIARQSGGRYAVVHDAKGAGGWDVLARGFSIGLTEEWQAQVATGLKMPPLFVIGAGSRGEWLVAGPVQKRLTIRALASNGQTLWDYTHPAQSAVSERLWNVGDLSMVDSEVIVPFTLLTVGDDQRLSQQVRVLKLPVRTR